RTEHASGSGRSSSIRYASRSGASGPRALRSSWSSRTSSAPPARPTESIACSRDGSPCTDRPGAWVSISSRAPTSAPDADEARRSMMWVETIINGVLYGGLYGLLGVGLALIVGVMRVVNLSHGEFIVLSAFLGVSLVGVVPWLHPLALLLPVALIAFALGFVLQAVLINRVVTRPDPFAGILLTFGVAVGDAEPHGRGLRRRPPSSAGRPAGPGQHGHRRLARRRAAAAHPGALGRAVHGPPADPDTDAIRPDRAGHRRSSRRRTPDGRESRTRLQPRDGPLPRAGQRGR